MLLTLLLTACKPEEPTSFSSEATAASGYATALCLPLNTGHSQDEFSGKATITVYGMQKVYTYDEFLEFAYVGAGAGSFALHCAMLNNEPLGGGVMAYYNIRLDQPLEVNTLTLVYWGNVSEVGYDQRFRSVRYDYGTEESKTTLRSYDPNAFAFNLFAAHSDIVTVIIYPIPEGKHISPL